MIIKNLTFLFNRNLDLFMLVINDHNYRGTGSMSRFLTN